MAELVGLVASSIAIAEAAGKVGGRVLTLKKLWDEVQNVPDAIQSLMTEIELLEPLLAELETDLMKTSTSRPVMIYCRKAVVDLDEIVQHLSTNLRAAKRFSRGKAKLKVILDKDTLKRCQDRMQTAVRLLTLAQQSCLFALTKSQPEIIYHQIYSNQVTQEAGLVKSSQNHAAEATPQNGREVPKRRFRVRSYESRTGKWRTVFGSFAWKYCCNGADYPNTVFEWMTRLGAPFWMSQRAWDLQISHSTSGWQLNLRPYCIRPHDHPVFKHAQNGETEALFELLKSGQASIYDTVQDGQGVLHSACWGAQLETTTQLVAWGADINAMATGPFPTVVHCVTVSMDLFQRKHEEWPGFHSLFNAHDTYEELGIKGAFLPSQLLRVLGYEPNTTYIPVEMFQLLQPQLAPNYYKLGVRERLEWYHHEWDYHDDCLHHVLFKDGTATADEIAIVERSGIGPLNLAAYVYQNLTYDKDDKVDSRLRAFVRQLIGSKVDLHFIQHAHALPECLRNDTCGYPLSTPLFAVLIPSTSVVNRAGTQRKLEKTIQRTLESWLHDLKMCGVDLCEYGRTERKMFRASSTLKSRWYPSEQWMRLSGFKYGPKPEDWTLEWDSLPERLAGEFWAMLDEQLRNPPMPGAWVDYQHSFGQPRSGYHDEDESCEISD